MNAQRKNSVRNRRRGVIIALAAACLVVLFGFMALGIDTGRIVLTQAQMQNAVDAAALAASQEITAAVALAGQSGGSAGDANSIAVGHAREMARVVCEANGVYIDPDRDVRFGRRRYDEQTGEWPILWDTPPYNVVKVTAQRMNPDAGAPDAALPMNFGWAVGRPTTDLVASATAFVEARDLVVILDYSLSMSDDSQVKSFDRLGEANVRENMRDILNALNMPNYGQLKTKFEPNTNALLEYSKSGSQKVGSTTYSVTGQVRFKPDGVEVKSLTTSRPLRKITLRFSGTTTTQSVSFTDNTMSYTLNSNSSNKDRTITSCDVEIRRGSSGSEVIAITFDHNETEVRKFLGLSSVSYPYPSGSWSEFVSYCRSDSAWKSPGYRDRYCGMAFVNYLLSKQYKFSQTPALRNTPHYPFHAMKDGATLFCDFLRDLDFGDEVGLVTYDGPSQSYAANAAGNAARWETTLSGQGLPSVNISSDPITSDYTAIDTIQRNKQAGHYNMYTAMGEGVLKARGLLAEHRRHGSRPTILLMTDGNPTASLTGAQYNVSTQALDFDGDGKADYTPKDNHERFAIQQAVLAADAGITIHTMAVGSGANRQLMQLIAKIGGGIYVDVPGGSSIAQMEEEMQAAFREIAAKVPPPKLVYDAN